MRFGKRPFQHDSRDLKLAKYVNLSRFPVPPASWDFAEGLSLPMDGNDRYGDCTCAAMAHGVTLQEAAIGRKCVPSERTVLSAYWATGNGSKHDDTGRNPRDVLSFWQKKGLRGKRIGPYATIATRPQSDDLRYAAAYAFRGIYLGFAVTSKTMDEFRQGLWSGMGELTGEGHMVWQTGARGAAIWRISTWGTVIDATDSWMQRLADEAYVALPNDWKKREPLPGFDYEQLAADLAALGVTG